MAGPSVDFSDRCRATQNPVGIQDEISATKMSKRAQKSRYFLKLKATQLMDDRGTACVTGGTGFIASWLIMRLLQRGYSVRTTIRSNPEGSGDTSFLENLPGASEKLQIFNADLGDPASFEAAIEGCCGVFHVAAPMDLEDREPEQVVTKRSIDGALGILKACLNSKTVRRVIYTSSASAVPMYCSDTDTVDENDWTDVELLRRTKASGSSYAVSKTLTEKAVLEFGETHGLEVVTVIPPFVHGPFVCTKFPGSVQALLALVLGNKNAYGVLLKTSFVHVDDVASAHIFLFEHPQAKGRYICSSYEMTIDEMSKFLSERYPEFRTPSVDSLKEVEGIKFCSLSSKKLTDLGFKYEYGVEDMFDGAIQCCKEKGYL